MAKFFGLDIPSGLEALFNSILSVGNTATTLGFKFSPPAKAPVKRAVLRIRSLIVLWQSLYDGFDSTRKSAWTDYWISLPFGSHGGANGWPGSGYSAFIYVNAPRYKNGEDLLLDPPSLWTTLGFWTFNIDIEDWYAYDGSGFGWDSGGGGRVHFNPGDFVTGAVNLDFILHHTLKVSFDLTNGTPGDCNIQIQNPNETYSTNFAIPSLAAGHHDFEFDYYGHLGIFGIESQAGDFYLKNILLQKGAELPLLPAIGAEILDNPDFVGSLAPWDTASFDYADGEITSTLSDYFSTMSQVLEVPTDWTAGTFRLEIGVVGGTGEMIFDIFDSGREDYIFYHSAQAEDGNVTFDFDFDFRDNEAENSLGLEFTVQNAGVIITRISLTRLS